MARVIRQDSEATRTVFDRENKGLSKLTKLILSGFAMVERSKIAVVAAASEPCSSTTKYSFCSTPLM